jgi:hypothetical protein
MSKFISFLLKKLLEANTDGGSSVNETDDAVMKENIKKSNVQQRIPNDEIVKQIGLFEFEARYIRRPKDDVIIAVALVSSHTEIELREKQIAASWLDIWEDFSFEYKLLRKKGMDLSSL